MLLDVQREALVRRIRETIQQRFIIVVMGWRNNHHTPFTRGLSDIGVVRFYDRENPPKEKLGPKVGLILSTEYVKHTYTARVEDERMCSIVVHYHIVIQILESCSDLLVCPCGPFARDAPTSTAAAVPAPDTDLDAAIEVLTRPPRRSEMATEENSTMTSLVKAFDDEKDKEGRVGIRIFKRILARLGIKESPQKLLKEGWIIPCVKEGNDKTGSYKAGPKMIEAGESAPPEDSIEYAKWLLDKKPELLARKTELQTARDVELAEVNARYRSLLEPVEARLVDINAVENAYSRLKSVLAHTQSSS